MALLVAEWLGVADRDRQDCTGSLGNAEAGEVALGSGTNPERYGPLRIAQLEIVYHERGLRRAMHEEARRRALDDDPHRRPRARFEIDVALVLLRRILPQTVEWIVRVRAVLRRVIAAARIEFPEVQWLRY